MKSKEWIQRQNYDFYVKKAKSLGYVSRSAFKLIEIDEKFNLILKSNTIAEFGSSPGGWSQIICSRNHRVKIYCFDLLPMQFQNKKILFHKKNFLEYDFNSCKNYFDLVLSDVAPNTTGHKSTDHLRIMSLVNNIIDISKLILKKNGSLVFKIWRGSKDIELINNLKKNFKTVKEFKPKSSRSESSEIYFIAKGYFRTENTLL